MQKAMHAARLAMLEGALCALFREAMEVEDPNEAPDGIVVHMDANGLDIEYTRGGIPVAAEGL
jgi:hypothetical protein